MNLKTVEKIQMETHRETKEPVGGENRAKEKYYDIYVIGLAQGEERIEKK